MKFAASKDQATIKLVMRYYVRCLVSLFLLCATSVIVAQNSDVKAQSETISSEVTAAEAAIAHSDWKSAESQLQSWISTHPDDAHALFDAGYVADAQDRTSEAEGFYRQAIQADPKSFEAHISLGLLLARQKKMSEAQTELSTATQLDPGEGGEGLEARAWRALAQIDAQNDPIKASNDLLEALKISAETEDDTLLAAQMAEKSGQLDTAEAAYNRVLVKSPKSTAANTGLAHLLITEKKYPEAQKQLRKALEQMPDDPVLTAQLATVLAAQNNAEALPLMQQLHASHPEDQAITRMLATVLTDAGKYDESDTLITSLLATQPQDAALLVSHGQNQLHMEKYADALSTFKEATTSSAENIDGWSGLAFAASKLNQPAVTITALTERAKYAPDLPSTYFLWATAYDELHKKTEAVTYYRHFLDSAKGKFPNQEWQARQRIQLLGKR